MKKTIISLLFLLTFTTLTIAGDEYYLNFFDGPPGFSKRTYHKSKQNINETKLINSFKLFMSLNLYPKSSKIIENIQELLTPYCSRRRKIKKCYYQNTYAALNVLRFNNVIDNMFVLHIKDELSGSKKLKDVSDYLKSLHSLYKKRKNNTSKYNTFYDLSFLQHRILGRKLNNYKGLSPRQYLYTKYNSFQIKKLSSLLNKTINIMNSSNSYIYISIDDNFLEDIRIDLSYTEKYRLSIKLLNKELSEMQFDNRFMTKPMLIDILTSGVETGIIEPDTFKLLYMMPEFKDDYRNRYKIYIDVVKKIGKYVITNTPVVGTISILPIIIIEVINEMKQSRRNQANETHLF